MKENIKNLILILPVHMLVYFFLAFSLHFFCNSYVWCQSPENLQESSKQAILLWFKGTENMLLQKCLLMNSRLSHRLVLGLWLQIRLATAAASSCFLQLMALELCMSSAAFYPDPLCQSILRLWVQKWAASLHKEVHGAGEGITSLA